MSTDAFHLRRVVSYLIRLRTRALTEPERILPKRDLVTLANALLVLAGHSSTEAVPCDPVPADIQQIADAQAAQRAKMRVTPETPADAPPTGHLKLPLVIFCRCGERMRVDADTPGVGEPADAPKATIDGASLRCAHCETRTQWRVEGQPLCWDCQQKPSADAPPAHVPGVTHDIDGNQWDAPPAPTLHALREAEARTHGGGVRERGEFQALAIRYVTALVREGSADAPPAPDNGYEDYMDRSHDELNRVTESLRRQSPAPAPAATPDEGPQK